MDIEGHLNIRLSTDSGRVFQVRIESSRPVHASRVLEGKSIEAGLKILPMLFSICGTAQACAGVRSCEQALGVKAAQPVERVRDALVRMETLREHLWRILLDWPGFLGEAPAQGGMSEMLVLLRDYRQAIMAESDPFRLVMAGPLTGSSRTHVMVPVELIQGVGLTLESSVFGMPPESWLDIKQPQMLEEWAASGVTLAARMVDHVIRSGWSGLGGCEMKALPGLDPDLLHNLLHENAFVERPQWLGECRETSCLTRVDSPLLQQLSLQYRNGLLVRLVARLTEIAQLAGKLLTGVGDEAGGESVAKQNPGIGQVAAARGQLLHRVQVEGEAIVRYQILAPTEWNFHSQGVVAKALARLSGEAETIEQQARLLINAIDPCVGYELSVGQEG